MDGKPDLIKTDVIDSKERVKEMPQESTECIFPDKTLQNCPSKTQFSFRSP